MTKIYASRIKIVLLLLLVVIAENSYAQVSQTANDQINAYNGNFRPGANIGYYPPFTDEELADLMAGNPNLAVEGMGIKSVRPALSEEFLEEYGYDSKLGTYQHYANLGLKDNTVIIGFPSDEHRDQAQYCSGVQSELFANLYTDIWDDGENGTPVNDENYFALYLYKTVSRYKDHVKFWEIWNEPGFDYTGALGWFPPGAPGNWWDNNPDPCDYKLRAPIFHYIRILRISYEVIKTIDPEAYVAVSGIGYPSFLDAILRNTDNPVDGSPTADYPLGGGAYFDVTGFHSYPHFDGTIKEWSDSINAFIYTRHSDAAAKGIGKAQQNFQDVLDDYGYDGQTYPEKLWIVTECNIPRKTFGDFIGSELAQRNFMMKSYVECEKEDVLQINMYKLGEDGTYDGAQSEFELMGLYEKLHYPSGYNQVTNESGIAYKTTSDLLFGKDYDAAKTAAMNMPADVDGGAFKDANGNYTYMLWARTQTDRSEDASATYSFPVAWNLSNLIRSEWDYGKTYEQTTTNAQVFGLTSVPIFLTEKIFSASSSNGCAPTTIQFTDASPANAASWEWTFEGADISTSTDQNPSVTFTEAGSFDVNLKVKNNAGNTIAEQSQTIVLETLPTVAFSTYEQGAIVEFFNETTNNAESFLWDFGDGATSTEPKPSHVYFASGTYTVTLTAINECGVVDATQEIEIIVPTTSEVDYTAEDFIDPYEGGFKPGCNLGIYPLWLDEQLADIAAGNINLDVDGAGVKAVRPILPEDFLEFYGYDFRLETYQHFENLDLRDNTAIIGFPSEAHREETYHCPTEQSELFANLYTDIWDNGENGTPINEDNYFALYLYKTVSRYKDHVKFWEVWNEPGFDYSASKGWLPRGLPGNWWDNNPDPCDYKLRAPIQYYIRLLRISWEVIKTVDPDAYVTVSGVGFPSFLDAVLRNTDNPVDGSAHAAYPKTGGAYFDVIGFHSYPHFDGSTSRFDTLTLDFEYFRHSDAAADGIGVQQDIYRTVLEDYGYDDQTFPAKEWIITECNIPRKQIGNYIGSDESQRNFIIKAYIKCMVNDIHQLHIYKIGEDQQYDDASFEFDVMGLYKALKDDAPFNQQLNEEGIAYKTTSDLLYGTSYDVDQTAAMNLPNGVRGGAFKNADGTYMYVLWAETQTDMSESASATYSFPSSFGFTQVHQKYWDYSQTNFDQLINAQGINLSATPMFLSEQAENLLPPVAAFQSDARVGCPSFTVSFEDLSSSQVDAWLWSFPGGNPSTSTDQHPVVSYPTEGFYPVTLEVTNAAGSHATTINNYIENQAIPEAAFDVEVDGQWASFTITAAQDTSASYIWDFGDNFVFPAFNPEHFYFANGDYNVSLIAYNNCGADTLTQVVTVGAAPIADFVYNITGTCGPFTVGFSDQAASSPDTYEWILPGAIPSTTTDRNPVVEYPNPGIYAVTYIVSNTFGTDTLEQTIELNPEVVEYINPTLCEEESITINGVIYDNNNTDGMEVLVGAASNGCDSIVQVHLDFYPEIITYINTTTCFGDVIQGCIMDGSSTQICTEVFPSLGTNGCDSTVITTVTFLEESVGEFNGSLCEGESITINGVTYDEANPSGTEVLVNQSSLGCDSTVLINIVFHSASTFLLQNTLCEGEELTVNGTVYNESNPSGTEVIENGNYLSCDSTILIDLTFYPTSTFLLQNTLCEGEELVVNGTVYNESNPSGMEVIENGNFLTCDSTINVQLSFIQNSITNLTETICEGESYIVGTSEYNTSGMYIDVLTASNTCDSIIYLNLEVLTTIEEMITVELCDGDLYNGVAYSEDTELIETLTTVNGCDSLLMTFINVFDVNVENISLSLCEGTTYNGYLYTSDTTIVDSLLSINMCDSIVYTNLNIEAIVTTNLEETINEGESFIVGNNSYSEEGMYVDTLQASSGCDSIVHLDLMVEVMTSFDEISKKYKWTCSPNPFDDKVTIELTLNTSENITIELYDLHGRLVRQLINDETQPSGKHQFVIDGNQLTAGVYWCKLRIGDQTDIQKLIHL